MMNEGQVRVLLNTLKDNLDNSANSYQAVGFAGGISALEMVLEKEKD